MSNQYKYHPKSGKYLGKLGYFESYPFTTPIDPTLNNAKLKKGYIYVYNSARRYWYLKNEVDNIVQFWDKETGQPVKLHPTVEIPDNLTELEPNHPNFNIWNGQRGVWDWDKERMITSFENIVKGKIDKGLDQLLKDSKVHSLLLTFDLVSSDLREELKGKVVELTELGKVTLHRFTTASSYNQTEYYLKEFQISFNKFRNS